MLNCQGIKDEASMVINMLLLFKYMLVTFVITLISSRIGRVLSSYF